MSVLRKIIQRWSKDKQKPEEIILEQSNNTDNLSMHGPSTNTGRCILKEKLERLALSEDSTLSKTVLDMAQQFVHCL